MRAKLLITDLDNTLYDWVTYYAKSFDAMLSTLCQLTGAAKERLQTEFKAVHQYYGSSEHSFAAAELPSVIKAAGGGDRAAVIAFATEAFRAFDNARARHLSLYPGVREGLEVITRLGVPIVGHTEASCLNAQRRLRLLGVESLFQHLYCLQPLRHSGCGEETQAAGLPPGFIREFPRAERKPSASVVLDICAQQGVTPEECVYIGDSIARDVLMARRAGAIAVWARYGSEHDPALWADLVAVTHWTVEDVRRERELHEQAASVRPDMIVARFDEVCALFKEPAALSVRPR